MNIKSMWFVMSLGIVAPVYAQDQSQESYAETLIRIAASHDVKDCYHIEENPVLSTGLEPYFQIGEIKNEDYEGYGSDLKLLYFSRTGKPFVVDYSKGESVCILFNK